MITDTDFIIDLLSKKENAIRKSKELTKNNQPQNLCAPAVYEVLTGIEFAKSIKERIEFDSMIKKFPVFPFDLESSKISGKIHAELLRAGEERGSVDIQIASIALANNETLLSNDSDFNIISKLFGLETEGY